MTIKYQWVASDSDLAKICKTAAEKPAIALDTEFIRIRSFYPKLGVIQLFDGEQVSLIDPLSISDFSPFIALLANPSVVKVLHACSEDLEVFWHQFHQMPEPMMDTQIIASFLNLGTSLGFAKLVQQYLEIELDKGASRTDWLARPLNSTQLQYAAADVFYLLPLYYQLRQQLEASPCLDIVIQECTAQVEKRKQTLDSHYAYKEISGAWQLTQPQLAVLQILAKWRLEEAQKRDLALNFVVKEQNLLQIAKLQPKHTSQLLEFMHPNEVRIHGKKLLWLVEQGKNVPVEHYPALQTRAIDDPRYKYALKDLQQKSAELVGDLFPVELLASKRQLTQLFKWYVEGKNAQNLPELLQNWRKPYGEQLLLCLKA